MITDGSAAIPPRRQLLDGYDAAELYTLRGQFDFAGYVAEYRRLGCEPIGLLEMMRGCPYACTFCAINQERGGARYRKPETVAREAEFLLGQGITEFYVIDPTFGLHERRTERLLGYLAELRFRHPELRLWGVTRCDRVTDAFATALRRAGFHTLSIGVETMDRNQLTTAQKRSVPEVSEEAVRVLVAHGIRPRLLLMHFPTSWDAETIQFLLSTVTGGRDVILQGSMYRPLYRQGRFSAGVVPDFRQWDQEVDARAVGLDTDASLLGWLITNLAFPSTSIRPEGDRALQERLRSLDLELLFQAANTDPESLEEVERSVVTYLRVGLTEAETAEKLTVLYDLPVEEARRRVCAMAEKIRRGLPQRVRPASWHAIAASVEPFHCYYYQPGKLFPAMWLHIEEGDDPNYLDSLVIAESQMTERHNGITFEYEEETGTGGRR